MSTLKGQNLDYCLPFYPQIVGQRLADQIPLVIHYYILKESANQLQREMLQAPQNQEKIEFLLQEDSGIKDERIHLKERNKRLLTARHRLMEFSMNN